MVSGAADGIELYAAPKGRRHKKEAVKEMAELTQESNGSSVPVNPADTRNDIEIDTSILMQQEKTTTSLCDKYGVHIFGENAETLEDYYEEQQERKQETILTDVLTGTPGTDREEILKAVMEADPSAVVRKDYESGAGGEGSLAMYAYVLAGVLLAGAVLFYIEKRRKGKKQDEAYSYDYEQSEGTVL